MLPIWFPPRTFYTQDLVDDWRGFLDNDEIVGTLFIDLSKAFDSRYRIWVFVGLSLAGLGSICMVTCSVLVLARLDSHFSHLQWSSPGFSIGPLVVYYLMNNLPVEMIKSCEIQLYADDAILYCHGRKADEVRQKLTDSFQTTVQWFRWNRLMVNIKKTHTMFLGRKRRLTELEHLRIEHEGQTLRNEATAKYLEVLIDNKLCWREHIDSVGKKVSRSLGMFRRVNKLLPVKTRKVLFNAIVLSYLDYCSVLCMVQL